MKSIWGICLNSIIVIIPNQNEYRLLQRATVLCKQQQKSNSHSLLHLSYSNMFMFK